jgi:hypothetical protein
LQIRTEKIPSQVTLVKDKHKVGLSDVIVTVTVSNVNTKEKLQNRDESKDPRNPKNPLTQTGAGKLSRQALRMFEESSRNTSLGSVYENKQ